MIFSHSRRAKLFFFHNLIQIIFNIQKTWSLQMMKGSKRNQKITKKVKMIQIEKIVQAEDSCIVFNEKNENDQKENPMKKYLNYRKSIVMKTLTQVINNHFNSSKKVQPTFFPLKKQISIIEEIQMKGQKSLDIDYQDEIPQCQVHNISSRKLSTKLDFQSITISIQNFLEVKQQPVSDYYQLKQKIGQGTFGTVYRGICKKSKQERAIKVLKTQFLKGNQNKQFLSQMTLLSKLQHPAIIKLYDLFQDKNYYYVVMEYCKGGSILKMFKNMKVKSEKVIINIMKQLFSALSYLHSLNIIHRDIKLDNMVFLENADEISDENFTIKIIDFGTAVQCKQKITKHYPIAGTLSYLAPQVLKEILVDKSDIWSSAVIMIILFTGTSPFKNKNEIITKNNIVNKHINFDQSPYIGLSNEAKALLKLMLKRNYNQRISAAEALRNPFFKNTYDSNRKISYNNVEKLKNFYMQNNFISVIQSYLSLKKINQAERQELSKLFTEIDTDHSGTIEISQFISLMKKTYRQKYNQEDTAKLIRSIDKDKSGKIDLNQFIMAMYSRQKLFVRQSLDEAFDYFDKEKDGFLQASDIRNILKGSQNKQIEYFIDKLDIDKDNKISRQEFVNYLSKF